MEFIETIRQQTCSGLRPGGHQAYSSNAQPESSSLFDERECKANIFRYDNEN